MSMTWKDVKLATLQKMFAADGSNIPSDKSTMDYIAGMPYVANEALQRLSTAGKFLTKSLSIAHEPLNNLLGDNVGMAITSFSKDFRVSAKDAHSCYFEYSGKCDLTIAIGGIVDKTISLESKGKYTSVKMLLNNPDDESVELYFDANNYRTQVKNIALYTETFDDENEIPIYAEKVRYFLRDITEDFYNMSENQIYYEGGEITRYMQTTEYYRESDKVLLLDRSMPGNYTVYYHAYPPEITLETDDDYVLPLDRDVVVLMPLYMASQLYKDDDAGIATTYRNEFEIAIESLQDTSDSQGFEKFTDESGWV